MILNYVKIAKKAKQKGSVIFIKSNIKIKKIEQM